MRIIDEIDNERKRQVEKGHTQVHDDQHINGEIADGAIAYIMASDDSGAGELAALDVWPFYGPIPMASRRAMLVSAAAMLVAEIERMDRAQS